MTNATRSKIMKNAWEIRKQNNVTMSMALKSAWAIYKLEQKAEVLGKDSWYASYKVTANVWNKYGKSRTYINMEGYTESGKFQKSYKVGYVDNCTGYSYVA